MVATTHKGSLACAAAALPGQGQVAPRGCGTHGLDRLGSGWLGWLLALLAAAGWLASLCGNGKQGFGEGGGDHHHKVLACCCCCCCCVVCCDLFSDSQRSTASALNKEIADSGVA